MSTFARDVTLSLALVSTKIRLEPVRDGSSREATSFKMGHACSKTVFTPIKQHKWCPHCEVEVTDPVKLRAVDGGWAVFTADEIKEMKKNALVCTPKVIQLTQHDAVEVNRHTVPTGDMYYVYSDIGGSDEALSVIHMFVDNHPEKALVSIISVREGSEHLARLSVFRDTLALELLRWPEEISGPKDQNLVLREGMLELFEKIADSTAQPFDVNSYRNSFRELVAETERSKVPGEGGIDVSALPTQRLRKAAGGMDLMEALEAAVSHMESKKR